MERKQQQQQHRQQQPTPQQRDGLSAVRDRRHESFVDRQKRLMQEALVCLPAALVLLAHEYARPVFEGIHTRTLKGHTWYVSSLVVLPTGELASGSWDNTIRVWDTDTGECKQVLKGHTGSVFSLVVLPTGELASGSEDETIRVWH